MPTRDELIAHGRSDEEIRRMIGADALIYQSIEDMKQSVRDVQPAITNFDASCFDGVYITGDITPEYLDRIEHARMFPVDDADASRSQLNLNLASEIDDCCLAATDDNRAAGSREAARKR